MFEGLSIPDEVMAELRSNVARRLTPQPVKIRADVHLECFSYAGIDAIRRALKAAEAVGTESIPIKAKLIAPPLYVLLSNATDKNGAIETMEKAITVMEKTIKKEQGECVVKLKVGPMIAQKPRVAPKTHLCVLFACTQPKAVSETDDLELNALMERVARENKEVSGDEASDEED